MKKNQSAKTNFATIKNISLVKTERNTKRILSSVPQFYHLWQNVQNK